MSKLLDMLRNATRSRGKQGPNAPAALLSQALRRASDERAALRAASPEGPKAAIDIEPVESVESIEISRIAAEAEVQERLAAAARQRVQAEQLALQTAHLRIEAEQRATMLAKEREETERSAAEEALRSEAAEAERLATAKARAEADEAASEAARQRTEAEREAAQALEERLRLESESPNATGDEDPETRRLKRGLFFTIAAIFLIGAAIVLRNFLPGNALQEHGAPLFKLERELKTPPDTAKK